MAIVNNLPNYTEEHRLPLIAKSVLGAKSPKLFTLETGVKGPTALNEILTDVQLQNASSCGWNAQGSATLSQRVITPKYVKVNTSFCDKSLLKSWTNYQVQIAAGTKTLPFEKDFTNGIVEGVQEKVEKIVWTGDKSNAGECDGIITILHADGGYIQKSFSTPYATVKDVYLATPDAVRTKSDYVIFTSLGKLSEMVQELVSANLYHYDANDADGEVKLPGTNVRVIGVPGLNGTNYVMGARLSNVFYGTDMQNDEEKFDLWYSKDNQEHRLAIEFMIGTQVAFPDEIVLAE